MCVSDVDIVSYALNKRGILAYKGATQLKIIESPTGFPITTEIHSFFKHV